MKASMSRILSKALTRARSGKPWRFSRIMQELIPFNRPHRISVLEITPSGCKVNLPHRRRNLNHLGTLHACAMATAGEYVSGLNVIEAFDLSTYRLIMSHLEVQYHRRPDGGCIAHSSWSEGTLESIKSELTSKGVVTFSLEAKLIDSSLEHVATTTTLWQVKSWSKIKSK
jgi:acyl-coenzyme A thioesterase PaaI-like protein